MKNEITEIVYNDLILAVIPTDVIDGWEKFINTFHDTRKATDYVIRQLKYVTQIDPQSESDVERMNIILQKNGYMGCTDFAIFILMRDVERNYKICKNCGCFSANVPNFCAHFLHSVNPYDNRCGFYLEPKNNL